jgi:hypothetical protein
MGLADPGSEGIKALHTQAQRLGLAPNRALYLLSFVVDDTLWERRRIGAKFAASAVKSLASTSGFIFFVKLRDDHDDKIITTHVVEFIHDLYVVITRSFCSLP